MSKLTSRILFSFTFIVTFSGMALAADHMVGSNRPIGLIDGRTGVRYGTFVSGNAAFAWTEGALVPGAFAHVFAEVTPRLNYEFVLVSTTFSDRDTIKGLWDIKRNGVRVCASCVGMAYGLSSPVGTGFKLYVGTRTAFSERRWHYSGAITSRADL